MNFGNQDTRPIFDTNIVYILVFLKIFILNMIFYHSFVVNVTVLFDGQFPLFPRCEQEIEHTGKRGSPRRDAIAEHIAIEPPAKDRPEIPTAADTQNETVEYAQKHSKPRMSDAMDKTI